MSLSFRLVCEGPFGTVQMPYTSKREAVDTAFRMHAANTNFTAMRIERSDGADCGSVRLVNGRPIYFEVRPPRGLIKVTPTPR